MADTPGDPTKKSTGNDQPAPATPPKRPFATIDLKATEVKVTPVSSRVSATAPGSGGNATGGSRTAETKTPGPAPASSYGDNIASQQGSSSAAADGTAKSTASSSAASAAARNNEAATEKIVVKKSGGFISHTAAGIIGGVLALAGAEWALPQIGITGTTSRLADTATALSARVKLLEEKSPPVVAGDSSETTSRISALETAVAQIPQLTESQSRLVAETKAALAASASDSGATDQITRIAALEDKLKALADAGANDPNANRLAQLAALTGKVADLETSLATQLTALRKSVADDVEGRITAATEASEAAKSGTQRIDRDVAGVKGDAVRLEERLLAMKADVDRVAASVQLMQETTTALKTDFDAAKSTYAAPADIGAAVDPLAAKLSAVDERIQSVINAEDARRANSERIVLALELQNLKRALNSGSGYASELSNVQQAAGNSVDLKALDAFKDVGVPPVAVLASEFRNVAYAAIDADTEPAEGSVVDRLLAGAKSVVRIRKVDHTADDKTAEAVVGRMEIALKDGKLDDVLTQSRDLGPKAQEAIKPFLDKVAARAGVDSAVAMLEAELKTSLKPSATP